MTRSGLLHRPGLGPEDLPDEGEMGFTYEQLDEYLTTGQAPEAVGERIDALAQASAHKRALPPIPTF